jgi:hypothetical protein
VSEYNVTTNATTAPFEPTVVALAANTTKTVLQVAVPSTTDIIVLGWSLGFDGSLGTAVPVICNLIDTDVGASGLIAQTPALWGNSQQPASLCVGGTAATGHGAGVTPTEGTITNVRSLDVQYVHPQSGYGVFFVAPAVARVGPSRFLRVRVRAQAVVNCLPEIFWAEPAV